MKSKRDIHQNMHHLCVLIHGLWGNPGHMENMAKSLRERYPQESFHILNSNSNCGSYTYDGIQLGGERLCLEIENEVERLAREGIIIQRFSVAAYSLGGLFARYAIGLLENQGFFDSITPVNFTAFASPFLGTRSPLRGLRSDVTNVLAPYAFCASGRELFMIDDFRETGRPLLEILADADSIFLRGLAKFKRHSLYANITNDPSAVYYTTTISATDPYSDLDRTKPSYLKGYDDIIVDINGPVVQIDESELSIPERVIRHTPTTVGRLLFGLGMTLFVPLFGFIVFLTFLVQSFQSPRRIYLHRSGLDGAAYGEDYNVPLLASGVGEDNSVTRTIHGLQGTAEDVYQSLTAKQNNEYLSNAEKKIRCVENSSQTAENRKSGASETSFNPQGSMDSPTLALTPAQFSMMQNLNSLGWRKYPVHIHKVRRAHAALIVRIGGSAFDEGITVFRHWLDKEFLI